MLQLLLLTLSIAKCENDVLYCIFFECLVDKLEKHNLRLHTFDFHTFRKVSLVNNVGYFYSSSCNARKVELKQVREVLKEESIDQEDGAPPVCLTLSVNVDHQAKYQN